MHWLSIYVLEIDFMLFLNCTNLPPTNLVQLVPEDLIAVASAGKISLHSGFQPDRLSLGA
jgi:hypothetical protein